MTKAQGENGKEKLKLKDNRKDTKKLQRTSSNKAIKKSILTNHQNL